MANEGVPATVLENAPQAQEAPYLVLSSEKAAHDLGWRPKLDFDRAVDTTAQWYKRRRAGADRVPRAVGWFIAQAPWRRADR